MPPFHYALHGDNCTPRCCNPDHLRWGSAADNAEDRDRLGRRTAFKGEANSNSKLSEDVVRAILASDEPQWRIGKRFGISQAWVCKIKRREVWRHLG